MNILDLKRGLLPLVGYRMPSESDGGNGNTGTSGASNSARNGSDGGSGGNNLGLSNYGSLADGFTGYSPTTGYTTTQVSEPAPSNYGYTGSTANADRTNVGVNGEASSREKTVAAKVNEWFTENPWARALPFANAISMAAKGMEALGGTYSDTDIGNALASGSVDGFNPNANGGGGGFDASYKAPAVTDSSTTSAPSVIDALAGTLNMSNPSSGWGDYVNNTLPGLQTQADQATTRGNAAYDTAQTKSDTSMGLADQMNQDYTNIYRPFGQKMANEVNNLNSDSYLSQQRGKAMADVQQQSDAQMQAQQRNLQRMGVNPSSGRALAMGNQNVIATAAAKAGAAGQSDAYNKQNYLQGLSSMNNMGSTLQTQARANNSQALDWSKYGLASGVTGMGANMDVSKLTSANAIGYGGLENQKQSVANGATQIANQQNQYNSSNDLGNLATSAFVGTAVKGLGDYLFG